MIYQNIVDSARRYCMERSKEFEHRYETSRAGIYSYRCLVMDKLLYWVETAIDADFDSAAECTQTLTSFVNRLQSDDVNHTPNALMRKIIDDEKKRFVEFVLSLDETCPTPDLPYNRTVIGEEKENIEKELADKWDYVRTWYWDPLCNATEKETLFLMEWHVRSYFEAIATRLQKTHPLVFRYGEGIDGRDSPYCAQTSVMDLSFSGRETVYFDQELTWIIYLSHEQTITFAGSILPIIKSLLAKERDQWNRYWDIP